MAKLNDSKAGDSIATKLYVFTVKKIGFPGTSTSLSRNCSLTYLPADTFVPSTEQTQTLTFD